MTLSICIPTYNRRDKLESLLRHIDSTAPADVEIVVSDNASTDGTHEVLQEFKQVSPRRIRVHRNDQNLGLDENVRIAVRLAQSEFVWLMGDDDSFDPSAFDQIKRIIAADPSLGLIYMNYEGWSPDLSQRTTPPIIKATQDQRFAQGLDLLALVAGQISCLCSVCVRRDLFISGLQDMDDRDKSSIVDHVWPLLYVLKHAPAHFVAQPLVKCRTGDEDRGFNALDYIFRILDFFQAKAFPHLSPHQCHAIKMSILHGPLLSKIQAYRMGLLSTDKELFQRLRSNCRKWYSKSPYFWLRVWPLLVLPKIFIRLIRQVKSYFVALSFWSIA